MNMIQRLPGMRPAAFVLKKSSEPLRDGSRRRIAVSFSVFSTSCPKEPVITGKELHIVY
jgi:hypothetical protein